MKTSATASVLFLSVFASGHGQSLTIDDSSSELNERFGNDSTFILNDYDLSGVGLSSNSTWATMVSSNVFISADHYHPANGNVVTFYLTNDPAGPSVERTVVSGEQIAGSDIWVGVLDEPLPDGYSYYEFATEDITDATAFSDSSYYEANAFMLGRSPVDTFNGALDVAVGRNVLDDWFDGSDDALLAMVEGEAHDVTYEATLVSGDSGAPLFVDLNEDDNDDTLTLIGTNWFVDEVGIPATDVNGFTYLGNYDELIQAYIDINAVPEPNTGLGFIIASMALSFRRRRRN